MVTNGLTRLYERGAITELQHQATIAWLEDGRPARRAVTKPRKARRPCDKLRAYDIMTAAGMERYKAARKRLDAMGSLDDLERAVAGDEADMALAVRGMDMLGVFYGMRSK